MPDDSSFEGGLLVSTSISPNFTFYKWVPCRTPYYQQMNNCHGMWMRIVWIFRTSSQRVKKVMVASTDFVQHELRRKWDNLDHLMFWNIMGMIIHNILSILYFICWKIWKVIWKALSIQLHWKIKSCCRS